MLAIATVQLRNPDLLIEAGFILTDKDFLGIELDLYRDIGYVVYFHRPLDRREAVEIV